VLLAKMTDYDSDLDVVDDSGTGVYALWDEDGEHIAYSPNGGATWDAPVTVPEVDGDENPSDPTIAGVSNGQVLLAYDNSLGTGDRTWVELINAAPITVPTSTTTTGSSVTVTVNCPAACTVTVTIEIPAASATAASAGHKKKAKAPIKLASRTFSLNKGGKDNLKLKLTAVGRELLRKDHDTLRTTLLLTSKAVLGEISSKSTLKLLPKKR